MKSPLIFIAALLSTSTFGQIIGTAQDAGIKLNGGVSMIVTNWPGPPTKTFQSFSGQAGFYYHHMLGNKFSGGAELLFIPMEGHEQIKAIFTDSAGNPIGQTATIQLYRHIYYLGLPVYFGYGTDRWNFNLGAQVNFALASGGEEKGKQVDNNGNTMTWDTKGSSLNIDHYDWGLRAGFAYLLTNRFTLEGNFYYGINNILGNDLPASWSWKNRQATIGIRYSLLRMIRGNNSKEY